VVGCGLARGWQKWLCKMGAKPSGKRLRSKPQVKNSFVLSKTEFVVRHYIVNGRLQTLGSFSGRRNRSLQAKRSSSQQRDMTASSFVLTLLLIATLAASSADHPVFWLLLGPAPLAAGVGLLAFLRPRFGQRFSRQVEVLSNQTGARI
jgi:hypothetical protein